LKRKKRYGNKEREQMNEYRRRSPKEREPFPLMSKEE
jgi:hypothetical protein